MEDGSAGTRNDIDLESAVGRQDGRVTAPECASALVSIISERDTVVDDVTLDQRPGTAAIPPDGAPAVGLVAFKTCVGRIGGRSIVVDRAAIETACISVNHAVLKRQRARFIEDRTAITAMSGVRVEGAVLKTELGEISGVDASAIIRRVVTECAVGGRQ